MTRTQSPEPADTEPANADPIDTQLSQTPLWDAMVAEFGDPLNLPTADEADPATTTGEADG